MNDETSKRKQPDSEVSVPHATKTAKRRKLKTITKKQRVGNFRSYYTYRLGQNRQGELEEDPRLSILNKNWFEGKRGLDIGCNSGEFTITIAKRLAPSYLLGVDVDPLLISQARGHLKDILRQEKTEKTNCEITFIEQPAVRCREGEAESFTDSSKEGASDKVEEKQQNIKQDNISMETSDKDASDKDMALSTKSPTVPRAIGKTAIGFAFPLNVIFKREDFVLDTHAGMKYDFITCFSVTKWIHLFHGDEGIKKVFAKIYELLTPGGRLILEPQPWKSYHKRKFTSETTAANYPKIQLRPKDFPSYLTETVGFRSCDFLEVCRTSSKGFRRPVYVAQK